MSEEQVVIEEITPATEPAVKAADPETPEEPAQAPAPAAPVPEAAKAKEPAAPPAPAPEESVSTLVEKLIGMGGEAGLLGRKIDEILKKAAPPTPSAAKSISRQELGSLIAAEVAKQLEPVVKNLPTVRKGLVSTVNEAEELRKEFESLPPEKKLRAVLASMGGVQ